MRPAHVQRGGDPGTKSSLHQVRQLHSDRPTCVGASFIVLILFHSLVTCGRVSRPRAVNTYPAARRTAPRGSVGHTRRMGFARSDTPHPRMACALSLCCADARCWAVRRLVVRPHSLSNSLKLAVLSMSCPPYRVLASFSSSAFSAHSPRTSCTRTSCMRIRVIRVALFAVHSSLACLTAHRRIRFSFPAAHVTTHFDRP